MNQILGKKLVTREFSWLAEKASSAVRVHIDLGCGDGKWTYRYAAENPEVLVIGIDSDSASLEKISHKADRKPAKGGLDNLIFIKAFAEDLPAELGELAVEGKVSQIFVNFPWGSLLGGVMTAQPDFVSELAKTASAGCALHMYTTYHYKYEPQMIEALSLPELNENLKNALETGWKKHGWQIAAWQRLDPNNQEEQIPQTSWWKQISAERDREVWYAQLFKK